jgi:L-lactate dehydrogenase complex protein LldG
MGSEAMAAGGREEVLRRIRTALADVPKTDTVAIQREWEGLSRTYKRSGSLGHESILELLEERLRDYDATVVRANVGEIGATITQLLTNRGVRRLVVPDGISDAIGEALPGSFEFVVDEGLSTLELDGFEGVLTGSTVAIAETGTIVLQNVPGQGRRAPTLIPDYHLCVVRAGDVVETVPQAMVRLAATASLATTFISGPSATADIEMTRIKGVHGPRFLDVILIP